MNGLTKNKIAAILIALYTLPHLILLHNWIVTDSPMMAEMGMGFAMAGYVLLMGGFMTAFGVWQDQKVYKIIAMISLGLNALLALPGIPFAPSWGWRLSAIGAVAIFVIIMVLLLRHTPQPVTA